MSVRFRICLAVWIVTVICSLASGTTKAEVFDVTDDWAVEISPAYMASDFDKAFVNDALTVTPDASSEDAVEMPVASQPCHQGYCPQDYRTHDYRRIYESIPFNRAEYNVNPSYRHDSTMELLTGNARHQTIVRHSTAPLARPRLRYGYLPYRYNNYRRGLNYYFYFPYWNYRGIY